LAVAEQQVAEQVAEGFEEMAEVTRAVDWSKVNMFLGGTAFGTVLGFIFGYRYGSRRTKAEALKDAEVEIAKVRAFYHERYESEVPPKPDLDTVVEERGYSRRVQAEELVQRPTRPPVPVQEPPSDHISWDYDAEIAQRDKQHPYVIHQNEYNEEFPEYTQVTWTYYAGDDILADERDEIVARPELIVGDKNLKRFGHGSDDANVVFIRNDRIEMEFEVCRSLKSYMVEVKGLDPDDVEADQGT
jgi:hypothetical protein